MTRLVLAGQTIGPGLVLVPFPAAKHGRVARLAVGDAVAVLDLDGRVGVGRLSRWEPAGCWVEIERVEEGVGEPPGPLILGFGVLHTVAADWAVEKATELGATEIVPVACQRVQGRRHAQRVGRWQRIASSAVAQCGRSRVPRVSEPCTLAAFLDRAAGLRVVADASAPPQVSWPEVGSEGVSLLVGPEGGLTAEELASAYRAGFVGARLGPRILRAETAVVAALTVVQWRLGWLSGR